ncbi:MAG TPA: hypothetical protein VGH19_12675 [Verrucomicrobiae bacterium]
MTSRWQFVLNESSVDFLLACRAPDRRRLLRVLDQLADDPYHAGDFESVDNVGRTIQIKRSGYYLISYWADTGPKELRIINIEKV